MEPTIPTTENVDTLEQLLVVMPKKIKTLFTNNDVQNSSQGIGTLHKLNEEQVLALENEISLTLLGLELISDFETRVKEALSVTDERLLMILEDIRIMIFNADIINDLKHLEAATLERENSATAPKAPPPSGQPGITVKPPEPVIPSKNQSTIKEIPRKQVPTGKMVGLKKEEVESNVRGMRTMRGDINRLQGSDEKAGGSSFTKPFKGS